jgi:ferredoxin
MGLHACDATGIEYLDKVFMLNDYQDELYIAERERTTLIGHICREMGTYCHCTDRGFSPDDEANFDVVFTEIANGLIFKAITEKGEKILHSKLLVDTDVTPPKKDWEKNRYPVASPEEIMKTYYDDFWQEMSDICLTCGSCTFECPTCVCFLISDEKHQGKGERVTVWDSCQNRSYSRMAGGHNPRKQNRDRVRNRTLDKFAYSSRKFGKISCVGCGRCIINCPLKRSFPQLAVKLSEYINTKKEL